MIFSSEKQLIFKVSIGEGAERLVVFGESHPGDPSTFVTHDASVIGAIRRHRFYKQGKIREYGSEPAEAVAAAPTTTNTPQTAPEEKDVLRFSNFSQVKAHFKKTYGAEAKALKTPAQVEAFAKRVGVVYEVVNS